MINSVSLLLYLAFIATHNHLVPPFDAGKDSTIQSIFEIEHLRSDIKLLNIQCKSHFILYWLPVHLLTVLLKDRMPPFIGKAISNSVYDGQLQSNPGHPLATSEPSCWFVHVEGSQECKSDTSCKVCADAMHF